MRRQRLLLPLLLVVVLAAACSSGNVFELSTGDCFDDSESSGEVSDVPIVDCDEPHDNEVFHTFELADDEFPGDDVLAERAQEECVPALEEYVGTDYDGSGFGILPITPTASSWEGGDHELVCALYDLELEKLEGSMQGVGQ